MTDQQQTVLSSAIAQRQPQGQGVAPGPSTIEARLRLMAPEFGKVLAPTLPPETFLRLALNEVRANPMLLQCTEASFMGALMTAARLQLEPGGPLGQFYLTPRRINGVYQVVPIIGYRGLRDLALRTRLVSAVQALIVREGDEFRMGSDERRGFWHEWTPAATDEDESDRPWRGVLAIAQLTGGEKPVWRYLDRKAVLARKAKGSAGDRGPWKEFEEAMVRKTGIRAIANDLPSSSIMALAVRADEQVQVWHAGQAEPQPAEPQQAIEPPPAEGPAQQPEPEPEQPVQQRKGRGRAPAAQQPQEAPQPATQGLPGPPPPDPEDYPVEDPPEEPR